MSDCSELFSSMTGSMNSGHLKPQKVSAPLPARSSPFDIYSTPESPTRRNQRQRFSRKMTLTSSPSSQHIQLTPLWEHAVRTRKFPSQVDICLTFLEISERLRDPEWEVRQHALRVLIDVLPTLNPDIVDKVMQPVVPELVNNLGHPAPAVRKGVLDAFRVFLIHSLDRENTVRSILQDGLNRSELRDSFQTNVTTGVILSVPSLLFPSANNRTTDTQLIKDATIALASRLAQVPHQEAVLKSLTKIRDIVGVEEFEGYFDDYDNKLKRNIEVLAEIYNVKFDKNIGDKGKNTKDRAKDVEKLENKEGERKWDSDSDTSGIAEEEEEVNNVPMPSARVVLETEIKFNEETAITMTILEEKESEEEQEVERGDSPDRKKTPRRVHFGGEVVKLRTPDSDEAESADAAPKTRIPLPVFPTTKMPNTRPRPSSQPCSPSKEVAKTGRTSRSVSSSPKKDIYIHNADLSPKKSILSRNRSPVLHGESSMKKNIVTFEDKNNNDSSEIPLDGRITDAEEIDGKVEEYKEDQVGLFLNSHRDDNVVHLGENLGVHFTESFDDKNLTKLDSVIDELQNESVHSEDQIKQSTVQYINERRNGAENDGVEEENCAKMNQGVTEVNEIETVLKDSTQLKSGVTRNGNGDHESYRNVGCERTSWGDRDKRRASVIEKNGNATGVAGEIGSMSEEPSWEELGLVDQEVLEDLHNKDDWRARVRGLERVASALRTSSALIAIEPRLGSLLHAVLGCERSCRVAAAGMAVAKIIVAGVSGEALNKRLPQLAWGLARQGGPSAAQLARMTMLKIRPALLLEQLLQPQCLNARNAKTRENTLQLLIFSLVTFPSTEFKVEMVATKVVKMVRDRRRRVRQAALDTLAVLAQIYEPEEIIAAGKRASEGYHDGEAMMAAIRARLSRKSLPLVSADGLVMYGLQISPAVQIATGPDVDWIVAGSGSVSPGLGRTKSQLTATRLEKDELTNNGNANYRENPWGDRQNFVALGVGMHSKAEQPIVWQMVPTQNQDVQCVDELYVPATRNLNTNIRNGQCYNSDVKSRNQKVLAPSRESTNYCGVTECDFERKDNNNKAESRIPILHNKEGIAKPTAHSIPMNKSNNSELININLSRRLRDTSVNDRVARDHGRSKEESTRSCGTIYNPRTKSQQENSTSMHYDNYRLMQNKSNAKINDNNTEENLYQKFLDVNSRVYQKFMERERSSRKRDRKSRHSRSSSVESYQPSLFRNSKQQTFVIQNMYSGSADRDGQFADENSFRFVQKYRYNKLDFNQENVEISDKKAGRVRPHRKTKNIGVQKIPNAELTSSVTQTGEYFPALFPETPYRRRLRSLSPSQLYQRQHFVTLTANEACTLPTYDVDKTVNENEYNEKNTQHFLPEDNFGAVVDLPSEGEDHELSLSDAIENIGQQDTEQDIADTQDESDSRLSSPERRDLAFDIITGHSSPVGRDSVNFIISLDGTEETEAKTTIDDDRSKDWSSEEEPKSRSQSRAVSRSSEHVKFIENNQNDSEAASDETARTDETSNMQERSIVFVLDSEPAVTPENVETAGEIPCQDFAETEPSPSRKSTSPMKFTLSPSRNSAHYEELESPRPESGNNSQILNFNLEDKESPDSNEENVTPSIVQCDNDSTQSEETNEFHRVSKTVEPPAIIIASRPHSSADVTDFIENDVETTAEDAKDDIFRAEPEEAVATTKRKLSRVPRVVGRSRSRGNSNRLKPIIQQCFSQLESKEWEVIIKGLKTLSHIAKQQPEYLDVSATPTISQHLGLQIKSLRSQVARTACSTAGDIFASPIRGIDQDFDEVAGALLHRTADTNRFLRSDSNAALDRMIEHLPPHKTIGVIVSRGASHQNAIVRAATARLLASVVDRVGVVNILNLPKDVRDKLLSTGARLLIDSNLDARNHAKRMFRRLTHCDGFRKALTDAVPETTLRHIDKTLKTL